VRYSYEYATIRDLVLVRDLVLDGSTCIGVRRRYGYLPFWIWITPFVTVK
jgi:hypothetical protein